MTTPTTCNFAPFVSHVVPRADDPSSLQLFIQQLENYLKRLKEAICSDLQNAGGGGGSFLDLSDTPSSYVGQANKAVRVNAAELALEFFAQTFLLLSDTPSTYAGSANKVVSVNSSATGLTFGGTIPDVTNLLSTRWVCLFKATAGLILNYGSGTLANIGTVQTPAPNNTSLLTSYYRASILSSTANNSGAGTRTQTLLVTRGDTATQGGFKFFCRVGTSAISATNRAFFGLTGSTTVIAGTLDPSALTNIFGIGYDAAETVLALLHSDNVGPATKTPLSASFPVDNASVYDITIYCAANSSEITWSIVNVGTGATDGGSVSTNLPQNSVWLAPQLWAGNGGAAGGVATRCDMIVMYVETFS